MNANTLKEYLWHGYELEMSLYNQRMLINSIQEKLNRCTYVQYYAEETRYKEEKSKIGIIISTIGASIVQGGTYGFGIWFLWGFWNLLNFFSSWSLDEFTFFRFSALISVSILPIIIVFFIEFFRNLEEAERISAENQRIRRRNEDIRAKNRKLQEDSSKQSVILKDILCSQTEYYNDTKNLLQMYYDKNIIFPKYRNFVAISSFYEYFCSGRCVQLEGHEGAYNIFENEIRQNTIIAKLDEAIARLEAIERNQYLLYEAIKESNAKTEKIFGQITSVVNNLNRIENNTEVMAYNNEITSRNTEYTKWLTYFKD